MVAAAWIVAVDSLIVLGLMLVGPAPAKLVAPVVLRLVVVIVGFGGGGGGGWVIVTVPQFVTVVLTSSHGSPHP